MLVLVYNMVYQYACTGGLSTNVLVQVAADPLLGGVYEELLNDDRGAEVCMLMLERACVQPLYMLFELQEEKSWAGVRTQRVHGP